ncbi:MAG: hypothetical protein WCY92_06555 [Novosphingobium sp.]
MVKITVEGRELPPIVTYPETPQPLELIEQLNGQRVTVETCRALEFGTVDPAGDGEAAELVRWLWEHAGGTANNAGRWNGWQAAAWIATNDLAVTGRLASSIEFNARGGGRRTLHAGTVEACLRWEIVTKKHCRCGADGDALCTCLDEGFGKLNAALRRGELIELGQQSIGPVNRENARGMLFASHMVRERAAFLIVGRPTVTALRDGTQLIDASALAELVEKLQITSDRRLHKEQRARWSDGAWSRPAIDRWWRENINPAGTPGPKKQRV